MSPFFIRALLFLPEGSQVARVLRGGAWGMGEGGEPQNPSGIRDPVLEFDLVCSFFFLLYTNAHSSSIYNSQKLKTTQMSVNRQMNKQTVV